MAKRKYIVFSIKTWCGIRWHPRLVVAEPFATSINYKTSAAAGTAHNKKGLCTWQLRVVNINMAHSASCRGSRSPVTVRSLHANSSVSAALLAACQIGSAHNARTSAETSFVSCERRKTSKDMHLQGKKNYHLSHREQPGVTLHFSQCGSPRRPRLKHAQQQILAFVRKLIGHVEVLRGRNGNEQAGRG